MNLQNYNVPLNKEVTWDVATLMALSGKTESVIFLDIDGVLNSTKTLVAFGSYPHSFEEKALPLFDWLAVALVRRLVESTNAVVVLSSTWRLDFNFKVVAAALGLPIIDATPHYMSSTRGEEISMWLHEHKNCTNYVVLDDDPSPAKITILKDRFVQVNPEEGFSFANYEKALSIMEFPEEPGSRNLSVH